MALTAFFLIALILDPSEPAEYAKTTIFILAGYYAYATGLLVALQRGTALNQRTPVLLHGMDMTLFTAVMFFSDGPGSPLFVYYVFLLVCATMRWQWRGTICTAGLSLSSMLFMVCMHRGPMHGDSHDLNIIIIRISYLLVLAGILGYLGSHEKKLRSTLIKLALWSRPTQADLQGLLHDSLSRAATLLKVTRIMLIWEEQEEPWLYSAQWTDIGLQLARVHPDEYGEFIHEQLRAVHFYTPDLHLTYPNTTLIEEKALRKWRGSDPLCPMFLERFFIRSAYCIPIAGKQFTGHFLALDAANMTSDELVLGEIITHEIVARLSHYYLQQELQQTVAQQERLRFARDLHDGILQSLTAVNLRLGVAQKLLPADPDAATTIIKEIQSLISHEQHDLRGQIQQLRPMPEVRREHTALYERLAEVAERFRCHWPIEVALSCNSLTMAYDQTLSREILLLVHEGMVNAARHAAASTVRVQLTAANDSLRIVITDDGCGFPFTGHFDLPELNRKNIGPKTLRERTASLGGMLALDSTAIGSTVEIVVPTVLSETFHAHNPDHC
jgi:signal transduction histidine kinase